MKKWDYKVLIQDLGNLGESLDALGKQGFELVGFCVSKSGENYICILKREI